MPETNHVAAELLRATQLLEQNEPQEAEQLLRTLLEADPDDGKSRRLLGLAVLQQSKTQDALAIFEQLYADTGKSPVSTLDLARALTQSGDLQRAGSILEEVLENVPTLTPGWYLYGDILVEQQRFAEARDAFSHAMANDPFREQIDQSMGAMQRNDFATAEQIFRSIVSKDPLHTEALAGLEALAMAAENWLEAERLFGLIRKRTRYWPKMLAGLSQLFLMTNRLPDARETLSTLLRIQPDQFPAWNMLGTVNELLMRHEDAIAAFSKSLDLEPNQPRACVSIGNIQRVIGDRAASVSTFESALRFHGMNGEAYWGLSNLKDYRFSDTQIDDMKKSLDRDSHSLHNAAPMYFALGMAMEERGDFSGAFAYYTKGNQIQKNVSPFDADLYKNEIQRLKSAFSADLFAGIDRSAASSEAPIFIVGMPRTGSTLVEQILASHSNVDATMELPSIEHYVREIRVLYSASEPYPECVSRLNETDFDDLADRYLESAAYYRHGAPRFTDKMPSNFVHVGLIHMMFPQAIIVDVHRHPLDTCIGCFKQRFAVGQPFSYSLADLGHYYQGYRSLMSHWQALLPDNVFSLNYEQLVSEPEPVIRELLERCHLAFEDSCLTPERTHRAIRTPSSEQVRRPITASRIGYWKNFSAHLRPLQRQLSGEIAAYDALLAAS